VNAFVATNSSGKTNVASRIPIVLPSVAGTQPASSAAKRNIPIPKARNPSGSPLP
jgi:hypothetical protein